jgi:hypothetical protein
LDAAAVGSEGASMIKPVKINGILFKITEELRNAEAKHPKFCDEITGKLTKTVKKALANLRLENDVPPFYADSILHEEICEALEAYQEGDKAHALQELAQCGAVIIRMMDFVSKEIEDENADKV